MSNLVNPYWESHLNRPALPIRESPCSDCAVVCGLYEEFSVDLMNESKETQEACSRRWFCHNDKDKACRGNWDYLGLGDLVTVSPVKR